jgi:hypothetical protein
MRRAQIKLFETVGVLVVFFFLLITGTVFYFNMQESALRKELQQQSQLRSLQAAQRAMFLPELDCSFVSVTRENCFDKLKLKALQGVIADNLRAQEFYFGLFGFANVTVREIYPGGETFPIYDNTPDQYTRGPKSHSPVLIYDPVAKYYGFGIMEVTTYAER